MPIYDMKCRTCEHEFEVLAPKPPCPRRCPQCSGRAKQVFLKLASCHNRLSPMNPNRKRGRG